MTETAAALGADGRAYQRLMAPLAGRTRALQITDAVLAPLRSVPAHPLAVARFGLPGLQSAQRLVRRFDGDRAPALLAGVAAHAMGPLSDPLTAGVRSVAGHVRPLDGLAGGRGRGVGAITGALVAELRAVGEAWSPDSGCTPSTSCPPPPWWCSATPHRPASAELAGTRLPNRYRRALGRFRYGPGVCKVDWALDGSRPGAKPKVPPDRDACTWRHARRGGPAARPRCRRPPSDRPYCIVAQPGWPTPAGP